MRAIQSVAVRISATGERNHRNNNAFRTAPFHLKPLARSCSPQWYEGQRRLRVAEGSIFLRAEIIAKVEWGSKGRGGSKNDASRRQRQQQAPPAEGLLPRRGDGALAELGDNELILAFASIDANATRDGYNYIQLFSPETLEDDQGSTKRSGGKGLDLDLVLFTSS